jgi:hypothetical protein
MFGDPEQLTAIMNALPDEDLWAVVRRRVSWASSAHLRALTEKGRYSPLNSEEQAELTALTDEVDQRTLLRSTALRLLKQRGHDVESFKSPGAKVGADAGEANMEGLPSEWFDRDIASDEPLLTPEEDQPIHSSYGEQSAAHDPLGAPQADEETTRADDPGQ